MKTKILQILLPLLTVGLFIGCERDLEPLNEEEKVGSLILKGYAQDTLQFFSQDNFLVNYDIEVDNDNPDYYTGNIQVTKSFALTEEASETLQVIYRKTEEVLATYTSTFNNPKPDTLSFFMNKDFYLEDVLDFELGMLSSESNVGYRFIFPEPNLYAGGTYEGDLEAVLYRLNGTEIGRTTIGKEDPGAFIEFPAEVPPIIEIRIVEAGTDEKYVDLDPLYFNAQEGNSYLYVLYELKDEEGNFNGIDYIDLANYFDYE